MLTIKEIFDICKEYDVFMDLSYLNTYYDSSRNYMIKLYYGRKRNYRLLDSLNLEIIFSDRESFNKYVHEFLEEVKEREEKK
jgi:hypothetical protein